MKAILVFNEMPKKCDDCPLNRDSICIGTLENSYGVWGCYVVLPDEDEKPYWCPLKKMPQEREFNKQENCLPIKVDGNSFALGWNACLEEINK